MQAAYQRHAGQRNGPVRTSPGPRSSSSVCQALSRATTAQSRTGFWTRSGDVTHICATAHQQPRQIPLILRSIIRSSAATAASVPAAFGPADPVVIPGLEFELAPDDCAVPALLVPGGGAEA